MRVFIYGNNPEYERLIVQALKDKDHEVFHKSESGSALGIMTSIESVKPTHVVSVGYDIVGDWVSKNYKVVCFKTHLPEVEEVEYPEDRLHFKLGVPITKDFAVQCTERQYYESFYVTDLEELLPLAVDIMETENTGLYNLVNNGKITFQDFSKIYSEVNPNFKVAKEIWSEVKWPEKGFNRFSKEVNTSERALRKALTRVEGKQRLLITGGYGCIGSAFINHYFSSKNVDILINIDALYKASRPENVLESIRHNPKYIFVEGNICNADLIRYLLQKYQITHIIHFAAQSHVDESFQESLKFSHDNVLGTHTLLEELRNYGKLEFGIFVSTDEVYGPSMIDEAKKTEETVLCPKNPYAATKAASELIVQSYYHSYKLPVVITRGNNVYGPTQAHQDKLIPRFIRLLKEGKKVTVHGDGEAIRGFLHVKDTARAFDAILNNAKPGDIINIGCESQNEYSVMEVTKILVKLIKGTDDYMQYVTFIKDRLFQDRRYFITNDKLKSLGWMPTINFIDGLKELI